MVRWAASLHKKIVVVATKLDRLPRTRRPPQLEKISARLDVQRERVIAFSAKERFGVDEVWRALTDAEA